jgi:hypothetical protein
MWNESDYESVQEIAMKRLKASKIQEKARIDKLVNEMVDLEFPLWQKSLSNEDVAKVVPLDMHRDVKERMLKIHFKAEILLPRLAKDNSLGINLEDFSKSGHLKT